LTLENLLVDDKNRLVIIDPGMALRVPYNDLSNPNQHTLTDVSEGSDRRLIKAQGQGGSLTYLAPEIVARDVAFDGFGIDLWAAGVILFVMLVGLAPFSTAHLSDRRFGKVAKGKLHEMLVGLKIQLSDEACDLLQNMFWMEPQKRLSLAQVMQHPWVLDEKLNTCVASNESKRAVDSTSKCPARQGKDQTVGKASFLHHKPHVRCGSAPA
jgi:serine/threonine protein kinase